MYKFLSAIILSTVLATGTAFAAPPAAAPANAAVINVVIGIVDASKIMNESPKAKALQDQLNQAGADLAKRLEAEKPNLTPEQFTKKQEAYYTKYMQVKQDLETQAEASMNQAIAQVAKEKNLYMVVYKSGVAVGGIDITDDVMKKMQ